MEPQVSLDALFLPATGSRSFERQVSYKQLPVRVTKVARRSRDDGFFYKRVHALVCRERARDKPRRPVETGVHCVLKTDDVIFLKSKMSCAGETDYLYD